MDRCEWYWSSQTAGIQQHLPAASAPPRVKVLDLFLKFLSEKHYFAHLVWCKCCCLSTPPIHHAGPACCFMTHSHKQVTRKEEQYLRGLAPPVWGQHRWQFAVWPRFWSKILTPCCQVGSWSFYVHLCLYLCCCSWPSLYEFMWYVSESSLPAPGCTHETVNCVGRPLRHFSDGVEFLYI